MNCHQIHLALTRYPNFTHSANTPRAMCVVCHNKWRKFSMGQPFVARVRQRRRRSRQYSMPSRPSRPSSVAFTTLARVTCWPFINVTQPTKKLLVVAHHLTHNSATGSKAKRCVGKCAATALSRLRDNRLGWPLCVCGWSHYVPLSCYFYPLTGALSPWRKCT